MHAARTFLTPAGTAATRFLGACHATGSLSYRLRMRPRGTDGEAHETIASSTVTLCRAEFSYKLSMHARERAAIHS